MSELLRLQIRDPAFDYLDEEAKLARIVDKLRRVGLSPEEQIYSATNGVDFVDSGILPIRNVIDGVTFDDFVLVARGIDKYGEVDSGEWYPLGEEITVGSPQAIVAYDRLELSDLESSSEHQWYCRNGDPTSSVANAVILIDTL